MTESKKQLIIENTRASLVTLPAVTSTDPEAAVGVQLLPGENNVQEWYWKQCKKVRAVIIWLAAGVLVEKGVGKARPLTAGLDSLDKQEAFIKIAKCSSVPILKDWSAQSKKKATQKQCSDRINELITAQAEAD